MTIASCLYTLTVLHPTWGACAEGRKQGGQILVHLGPPKQEIKEWSKLYPAHYTAVGTCQTRGGRHGGDNHNTAQGKGGRVGEAPRWLSDAAVTQPLWSE